MSSLDILKSKYKPYKYSLNKGVTIVESSSGKFVIKKQNKDLFTLFNYLETRGFNNFPKIIYNYENKENVFEYIEDSNEFDEQKIINLANTCASLHNKTVYYKSVSKENINDIYDNIIENIRYLKIFYEGLFLNFLKNEYMAPEEYLFTRNYSALIKSLQIAEDNANNWYELNKEKNRVRVAVVNNNLELSHFKGEDKIISWDDYVIDTPVLDIVNLYQKEYLNYDFHEFFNTYFHLFELTEDERYLLFSLLLIPKTFELDNNHFENTITIRKHLDYVFKSQIIVNDFLDKNE